MVEDCIASIYLSAFQHTFCPAQSSELGPSHPLTRRRVCPPFGSGGHTLACEIGVGEGGVVPIRSRGQTLWYSRYGLYFVLSSYSISARNSVKSVKISKPPPPPSTSAHNIKRKL